MHQVLFRIPIRIGNLAPDGIPLYGFGVMLCLAFIVSTWLGSRRAQKEGVAKELIQDLGMWLLVGGVFGARLASILLEGVPLSQFFRIWDGGLVLYGAIIGGIAGYFGAYFWLIRKQGVSSWQLADIIAPAAAVGIGIGRIGCYLNGCCYGGVACPDCPQAHFPFSSASRVTLVQEGYQTAAGFTFSNQVRSPATVGAVEPGSPAAERGLKAGDAIVAADGRDITDTADLENYLGRDWPRGKNDLSLTVQRNGKTIDLPAFEPLTLGLHPTQLYESISMLLVFLLLTAYLPFRKNPGEVMAVLMFCYGIHRILNEMIRSDPRPTGFEKYISVFLIAAGAGLWLWLRRLPTSQMQTVPAPA